MKPNILIVDDDPAICSALSRLLDRLGCGVEAVTSGVEAETKIAKSKPDIVLLDIMMPEQDGYDTCKHLRQQGFTGTVIMISAVPAHTGLQRAKGYGADSYLEKPISRNTLATCISAHFEKQ
jgi:CheY-like chemotaxis protein